MGTTITRRGLLATSTAAIAGMAGCSDGDGSEGASPEGAGQAQAALSNPEDGVIIEELSIVNFDDTEHTVHLLVEHDGETVHWDGHQVDAEGDEQSRLTVDAELPARAGEITLRARVGDDRSIADLDDAEGVCAGLQVVYDPEGTGEPLDIFRSLRECPERFAGAE